MSSLRFHARAHGIELTGGAQLFVLMGYEIRVFFHEYFSRRSKIELLRVIAEEFAMHARPNKPAIRIDVDLGDSEFGGGKIFFFIYAACRGIKFTAGRINGFDLRLGNTRRSVHDDRRWRQSSFLQLVANPFNYLKVQGLLAFEFVGPMARADGGGERIALGLFDKLDRFVWIGQAGMTFIDLDVFLNATEHSELGFDANPFRMRAIDHAFCDLDILLKGLMTGVDHD